MIFFKLFQIWLFKVTNLEDNLKHFAEKNLVLRNLLFASVLQRRRKISNTASIFPAHKISINITNIEIFNDA